MSLQEQLASLLQNQEGEMEGDGGELLSFRAGKMNMSGTLVSADPRKGKVLVVNEDGLMRMQWKLRPLETTMVDNIIVFPGEIKVELIPECTTGRVLLFTFASDPSNKLFFWLQEPDQSKDQELLRKLSSLLQNGNVSEEGADGNDDEEEIDLGDVSGLSAAEQEQLMNMFQSLESSAGDFVDAVADVIPDENPDEQDAMDVDQLSPQAQQSLVDSFLAAAQQQQPPASLNRLLDPQAVIPILEQDPEIMEAVLPHLPQGQRTREHLVEQLSSPQLSQTLARLTHVLNQGQGASLLSQLGLDPSSSSTLGVQSLLDALNHWAQQQQQQHQ